MNTPTPVVSTSTGLPGAVLKVRTRRRSRLFGAIFFVMLISGAIWIGGCGFVPYVSPPSLLIVVGGMLSLQCAVYGFGGIWSSVCRTFLIGHSMRHERAAPDLVAFWRLATAFCFLCGFLGTVIGLMAMLANMDDPSVIGAGMAAALLTSMYGLIGGIGCIVLAVTCARRELPNENIERTATSGLVATAFVVPLIGLLSCSLSFFVLIAVFSEFKV